MGDGEGKKAGIDRAMIVSEESVRGFPKFVLVRAQ